MTADPMLGGEPPIQSALTNPLEDWTNDDLLLDKNERAHFYLRRPRLAPIFDWLELRQAFEIHEQPAKQARKKSRGHGVTAVGLGFAGLALTALTPWLAKFASKPDLAERWTGVAAAALIALGTVVGLLQTLIWRAKQEWLINRYWTERIRQFHFQLILNNLEKAAAALPGGAALDAWRTFRQGKLADFLHDAKQTLPTAFDELEDDHAEEDVWVDKAWRERPPTPPQTPELAELLEGLQRQRIGVQERFTALKLKPGLHSPQTRAKWLHGASDAFTAVILVLTIVIGVIYAQGSQEPRFWLGAAGALTAAVVALRVLNEGLLLRAEAERYRWYLASVRSIARRFEKANTADRIRLLHEMERLAYQEMRRFLITFKEARFIM
jgi:hypothetical protein